MTHPKISTWRTSCAALPFLLAGVGCSAGEGDGDGALNVLLVTLDTTRPDRMSCYGYGKRTTPHIDAVAAQGVRFERAISTAGITPMSHSSILTGLNNYKHGMRVFYSDEVSHRLKESVDTLPEILGRHGYRTAAMVSSYPVSEIYGLDQGFDTFETGLDLSDMDFTGQQKHADLWHEGEKLSTQRRGDATVAQAVDWLDENGDSGPWCMWVHMFDVHDYSIVPPIEAVKAFGIDAYPRGTVDGRDNDWRERMYDPEMAFMDAQVGKLFQWLKDNGHWEDTIVVITADHGQGLLDGKRRHGWPKHRLLYDWCIRVPLIVRIPGEPTGVVRREDQVRTIDIVPTLLEALDVPGPDEIEGESLLGLMRGEPGGTRIAYADALNKYDSHSPRRGLPPTSQGENLYAVTDGRWKLIHHELQPENSELFDLASDPLEGKNVASEHPDEVARLLRFLIDKDAMRMEPPGADESSPDSGMLDGLGYGGGGDDEEEND